MAVYTEVGDTELEAFIAEYDIGEADSSKASPKVSRIPTTC